MRCPSVDLSLVPWVILQKVGEGGGREGGKPQVLQIIRVEIQTHTGVRPKVNVTLVYYKTKDKDVIKT